MNNKQLTKKLAEAKRKAEIAESLAICERMIKKLKNINQHKKNIISYG